MEESETNSVPPFVVGIKEMTTLHGYKDKKASSVRTSIVPDTSPWSTKEAFLSTVRPPTTKFEQSTGYKDKKTTSVRTSTVPATSPWATKKAFFSTVLPQTTNVEQSTECGVVYNSSCIRAIVYDVRNVTLSVAKSLCENKLANIYDVTHYNLVREYLRPLIPGTYIWARTGMKYKKGQLYSTTGHAMSLPTEVWLPNYPSSIATSTTVVVRVDRILDKDYPQAVFMNVPSAYRFDAAICENEL
uniref:uncharacterized protein LOC120336195 n=1 Tax=Styela clava TaxID=7725 RepID=UPI0019397FCA|nr:uncharacterized protein LOC120336195 [Styela clava]